MITSTRYTLGEKNVNRKDFSRYSDMETLWLVVATRNIVRIGHGTGSPAVNTAEFLKVGAKYVKNFQKAQNLRETFRTQSCHAFHPLFLGAWNLYSYRFPFSNAIFEVFVIFSSLNTLCSSKIIFSVPEITYRRTYRYLHDDILLRAPKIRRESRRPAQSVKLSTVFSSGEAPDR